MTTTERLVAAIAETQRLQSEIEAQRVALAQMRAAYRRALEALGIGAFTNP